MSTKRGTSGLQAGEHVRRPKPESQRPHSAWRPTAKGESRMTHSPSPWRRASKNSGHIWARDGDGIVQVAVVGAYSSIDMLPFNQERWDADANLISAAPEMLEALEAAVECGMVPNSSWRPVGANSHHVRQAHVADMIRAAIAKAKGAP